MVYHGRVAGGVVVLDGGAMLPDGTSVRVEPLAELIDTRCTQSRGGLGNVLDELEHETGLMDGPSDWAAEHDHYLYGASKNSDGPAQ
jgi:hypothetical protein